MKAKGVRPTTQRVKLAIFSMLGDSVIDNKVLDLYACTGALGLEAISRGAIHCDFDLEDSYKRISRINNKRYGDSKVTIYEVVSG